MKCPWLIKYTNVRSCGVTIATKQEMCDCVEKECPFYRYRYDYTVSPSKEIPFCSRAEK